MALSCPENPKNAPDTRTRDDDTPDWVPHDLPDWRRVAQQSIRYQRSFRPIRGVLPGDDEMYHLIIGQGQAPAQQYIVVAPQNASITTDTNTIDDCVQLNMLPWCLLVLISAVVSFATTLFLFLFLDSDKTETTKVLEAQADLLFSSQMTPSPGPYIFTWITAPPNSSAAEATI
ncbi:uncharacterized protein [Dermacentor albipictus]|uniref:uncharacterized protein isoform X2 n=1 Tax=Dermacentor albipictus TaxID=60249 RepID=UPI0031FD9A9F